MRATSNGDVIVYDTAVVLPSSETAWFNAGAAEIIDVTTAGYSVAVRRAVGVGYHALAYGRFTGPIHVNGASAGIADYYEALPIETVPTYGLGPAGTVVIYLRPGDRISVNTIIDSGWLTALRIFDAATTEFLYAASRPGYGNGTFSWSYQNTSGQMQALRVHGMFKTSAGFRPDPWYGSRVIPPVQSPNGVLLGFEDSGHPQSDYYNIRVNIAWNP